MLLFLLTTFSEWLETNIVAIVIAVVGWLASAGVVVWVVSQYAATSRANGDKLDKLVTAIENHAEDFDKHKTDGSIHTTFEFRQSVSGRLDRIEDEMKSGHVRIENKIDRLTERLLK